MSVPKSPTVSSTSSVPEPLTRHSSNTAGSTRRTRTVRIMPHTDSDSDEEVLAPHDPAVGQDIPGVSHHSRQLSYSGSSTTRSPNHRLNAIVSAHPRFARAATSSTPSSIAAPASSSSAPHPAQAPPSAIDLGPNGFQRWRDKFGPARPGATRSATAMGSLKSKTPDGGTGSVDMNDPDASYFSTQRRLQHLDDLASDEEDDGRSPGLRGWNAPSATADGKSRGPPDGEAPQPLAPATVVHGRTLTGDGARLVIPTPLPLAGAEGPEGRERLEWQSMLKSVLRGDVLQGESSRIGEDRPGDEEFRRELGTSFWWQMRARMRGRPEDEEKRRVEERRSRTVDAVLEEVDRFLVKACGPGVGRRLSAEPPAEEQPADDDAPLPKREAAALEQVLFVLEKLSVIESLYPHQSAFRHAKPLYDSTEFQAKVRALSAWSTVVTSLQGQLHVLQKWTGSDDLDITRPNTTKEKALVGKNRYHPLDTKAKAHAQATIDQAADDSTFLERIMKEDSLQNTFEKRVFVDLNLLVKNAKETVVSHSSMFEQLNLPNFQYELVRLIGFPGRLIIEALKVRLDAAAKLMDPNTMVINDMIDSFRLSISLAVLIKKQYEENVAPDHQQKWVIPHCLAPDFDAVVLDGLRTFFKLLHWKLKSGSRAIYFRETEVLEDEWEFLYEAAEAVPGGDWAVAEHFCSLTNKLMIRVCNYFDTQLHVPIPTTGSPVAPSKSAMVNKFLPDPDGTSLEKRQMSPDDTLLWYGKIMDAVRMRYRKLQRFARRLTQRFDNSAEYQLDDDSLDLLVQQLQDSGHFLVYTQVFEERGTYIMADGSLWSNPALVQLLLQRAFSTNIPTVSPCHLSAENLVEPALDETQPETGVVNGPLDGSEVDDDSGGYLLLLSPRQNFAWTGAVMTLDLPYIDFALEDSRIRLIADGPTARLSLCKQSFAEALLDPETNEPVLTIACLVEQQAHLPRVQRELHKIARSNHRLTESFIESAAHVRKTLRSYPGSQDMIENWYTFASEHGKRFAPHVDASSFPRYSRLLMRLGISWVSFICDSCDPTDRKTFRWTVAALRFALDVTEGRKILHLDHHEFSLLRRSVASLVSLLISHFDILGARSSVEAKKEAEKIETVRRLQRLQEITDDFVLPRAASPPGQPRQQVDRSVRLMQEQRLRLITEVEQVRLGLISDQHLVGQVLDEQVSEDRALVFLAASSSNIALRWQQGAFIGGGANGNVYLGFNLDSGGIMAVKEIRVQDLANSPTLYKQIKDESDVMSMLSHPNIVEYYGIEVHRDRVFIFQEYCDGGDLATQLTHGRIEDEDVIILWALQMLQGLQYLHSQGVEHRDVKPENILLNQSAIKFVDFGASKVINKGNKTMAKTRAMRTKATTGEGPPVMNSLAGTPMYMAPEVIRASEKGGRLGSADIWSMGCVLLEISTGRKPWSNLDNEWAIMFHIGIAQEHPPLPEPGQLSEIGIEFIEHCLNLDPSERLTATELLEHPWLLPMIQQMTEHFQETTSSLSGPSTTSTLVDNPETLLYANQMAELAKQDAEPEDDLVSYAGTPADINTPSVDAPSI